MTKEQSSLLPKERLEQEILLIRGEKVMLDADLAALYEVETRTLVQAVKRNPERFPDDFMFQLTKNELENLKSQIVISSSWGGRRSLPYAFTEHGILMLSSVLRSPRAISVNIEIMRAFIRMRRLLENNKELWSKIRQLERKNDRQFAEVFEALRQLMAPPSSKKRPIGFLREEDEPSSTT